VTPDAPFGALRFPARQGIVFAALEGAPRMKAPLHAAALSLALLAAPAALGQQQDAERKPSAAAGATAPTAATVVDPEAAARLFSRFDTNRDGRLSSAELDAARANQGNWLAIDRNRDGSITREEFTALGSE
jgi:hypothetical protein